MNSEIRRVAAGVAAALVVACATGTIAVNAQSRGSKHDRAVAENKAQTLRFAEGFNTKNIDTMMSTYSMGADLMSVNPDGSVAKGPDAVRKGWEMAFATFETMRIEFLEENYTMMGDGIVGTFRVKSTMKMAGKPEMVEVLQVVDLRRQEKGTWVVFYDHVTPHTAAMPKQGSLYSRLGGYDAIAAVVDEFVKRMGADPRMAKFLDGLSQNSSMRLRQLVVDQVCMASGGPCLYLGRDMKTSHKGLGISGPDWDIAAGHLVGALDHFNVPAKEKGELLQIVGTLRADIVEK